MCELAGEETDDDDQHEDREDDGGGSDMKGLSARSHRINFLEILIDIFSD